MEKSLYDYMLQAEEAKGAMNRFGLTAQGPTSPYQFGSEGLYGPLGDYRVEEGRGPGVYPIRSRYAENFLRTPPPNQPSQGQAPQGMMRQPQENSGANPIQSLLGLGMAIKGAGQPGATQGTIPGQQPNTPFSFGAVNAPGEGQPNAGPSNAGMNPYLLATILGAAGNAIGGRGTWQSRLGGNMAAIGSQLYQEQSEREYRAPDVAMRRAIDQERLKAMQKESGMMVKSVDPETGQEFEEWMPESEIRKGGKRLIGQKEPKEFKWMDPETGYEYTSVGETPGLRITGLPKKDDDFKIGTTRRYPSGDQIVTEEYTKNGWRVLATGEKGSKSTKSDPYSMEEFKTIHRRLDYLYQKEHDPDGDGLTDSEKQERNNLLKAAEAIKARERSGGMKPASPKGAQQSQGVDRKNIFQKLRDAGVSKNDIVQWRQNNPNATEKDLLAAFNINDAGSKGSNVVKPENVELTGRKVAQSPKKATPAMRQKEAQEAPDVKNTPTSKSAMQRKETPYNTSMTQPATPEQQTAAKQELLDLSRKLGVAPENWQALGQLAKNAGGLVWQKYLNALNVLGAGQVEARQQLPAYK